jgi:hypothetical protein
MRLWRHTGHPTYYRRHYSVYIDGKMLKPTVLAESYWLEHVDRNDPERWAIKMQFRPTQQQREAGGDLEHPQKMPLVIPPVHLGPLEYIGGGAWLAGIPARNLKAHETDLHYTALVENMASPRPIYRLPEPTEPVQDDQQQQQSEPAALPATSTTRRTKRRKE